MKQNKTKKQNAAALAEQDIRLYRLYLLFAVALVGFSAFRFLPANFFYIFHGIGTWIVTVLLLFALGAFIYIRRYLKPDESKRMITSSGVAYFLIPSLFMLAFYGYFSNAGVKFQIAFAMLSVYAIIHNIYKNNFRILTAVVFIALIGLYYIAHPVEFLSYRWMEFVFAAVAQAFAIALSTAYVVLSAAALKHKKGIVRVHNHVIFEIRDKCMGTFSLILSAVLLAASVLLFFASSLFVYTVIAVAALYVGVGILCTVRML